MIKVTCTSGTIKVYPTTGVTLPEGLKLPMVAPTYKGDKTELEAGQSMDINPNLIPAIGGNGGEFTITTDKPVMLVRWYEVDQDPIYIEDMQSYKDMDGNHTDDNSTSFPLGAGESYSDKTIRSNAITLTMIGLGKEATNQPA
jgi:hypothetical protein